MSTEHVFDELPLLLTGEADRSTVDAAAAHLRGCEDCQQELVSTLVAHASLASAVRFAPDLATTTTASREPSAVTELPDLSSVFARARDEADTPLPRAERRRPRTRWLVAATVAGLAVGVGGVVGAQQLDQGPAQRTVQLAAYGQGTVPATARIVGSDQVRLDAAALPNPAAGKRYEVWLTDADRKNLQPLGWVNADGHGQYEVPSDLMRHFDAIEVSVQQIDAPYNFSGVSVLRGSYA